MLKSLPENTTVMISLWLFLDDGSFFIIFPDEVNPYFDENRMITFYRISFQEQDSTPNVKISRMYLHRKRYATF